MERRRRVPRQRVGWWGACTFDDDPSSGWAECQVIDLSLLGAGVEVIDARPKDPIGRPLTVAVHPPTSASVSLRLSGTITNATRGARGGVRLGMAFSNLSPMERSILDALELMQVAW
ncbi:MAG TPA: PilZ domain-containing protein [Acidimicrobiales bacterium]|nr:PilZ domain-containing protein [Acidimicrobiales bacterium]